jgi:ABC-type oligopeptide transport system substrate-binding subunit
MRQKRTLVLVGVGVAFMVLALAILLAGNQPTASSTPQPKGGVYLHFPSDYQDGAQTKAYLVDSQLYYGVYNESFSRSGATGDYPINKGDPCIIINGTIQNDNDKDYYFGITANVYNAAGDKIEPVLTVNSPHPGFALAKIDKDSTGAFELQIKYEGKDIVNYDLFIAFEPSEVPPP